MKVTQLAARYSTDRSTTATHLLVQPPPHPTLPNVPPGPKRGSRWEQRGMEPDHVPLHDQKVVDRLGRMSSQRRRITAASTRLTGVATVRDADSTRRTPLLEFTHKNTLCARRATLFLEFFFSATIFPERQPGKRAFAPSNKRACRWWPHAFINILNTPSSVQKPRSKSHLWSRFTPKTDTHIHFLALPRSRWEL